MKITSLFNRGFVRVRKYLGQFSNKHFDRILGECSHAVILFENY
ncbi:hypothetical protein [Saccharolobus sp. E5-1-F]|nr:hypothetical protein [Sulfolobus sp. E5-1-F]